MLPDTRHSLSQPSWQIQPQAALLASARKLLILLTNGGDVQDVRVSGPTKALLSNINDPNGIRSELIELTPDSLHKQAVDRWK